MGICQIHWGTLCSQASRSCHLWELDAGRDILEGWVMLPDSFPSPVRLRGVELSLARYVLREHSCSSSVTSDHLSSSSTMLVSVWNLVLFPSLKLSIACLTSFNTQTHSSCLLEMITSIGELAVPDGPTMFMWDSKVEMTFSWGVEVVPICLPLLLQTLLFSNMCPTCIYLPFFISDQTCIYLKANMPFTYVHPIFTLCFTCVHLKASTFLYIFKPVVRQLYSLAFH